MKNSILFALQEAGIEATEIQTVKNGVICNGYRIQTGSNVSPVVYYSPDDTAESFMERVMDAARQVPIFDVDSIVSRENILKNCFLCIQKKSEENIIKRDFLDLELYIRIAVQEDTEEQTTASCKVKSEFLEATGISEEELFEAAKANSLKKVQIKSMAEALGLPEEMMYGCPMYIGSYSSMTQGAAIIALPEILRDWCFAMGVSKCFILPSSTEEVILLPGSDYNSDELADMVYQVNQTEVEPILQLNPTAYCFNLDAFEVSIAAEYVKDGE